MASREIPGRLGWLGPFDSEPLDNETSIESALERAAQTARIARLMLKGYCQPDTEEDGDLELIEHVLWANSLCLRRAIELHNANLVAAPDDRAPDENPSNVRPLRRKEGE
jgi:hypothetical protein